MFRSNHFTYNQIVEVTMPLLTSSKIIMLTRFKYYNKLLIKWVEFDLTTFFKRELLWVAYCSEVDNNHTFFRNYRGICTCDTWYICLYRWIDMGIKNFQRNSSFLNYFPIASSKCCNSNFQFFQKYSSWDKNIHIERAILIFVSLKRIFEIAFMFAVWFYVDREIDTLLFKAFSCSIVNGTMSYEAAMNSCHVSMKWNSLICKGWQIIWVKSNHNKRESSNWRCQYIFNISLWCISQRAFLFNITQHQKC